MSGRFCLIIRTRYLSQSSSAPWTNTRDVPNAKKLCTGFLELACFAVPKSGPNGHYERIIILWFDEQQSANDAIPVLEGYYQELTSLWEVEISSVCIDQTSMFSK